MSSTELQDHSPVSAQPVDEATPVTEELESSKSPEADSKEAQQTRPKLAPHQPINQEEIDSRSVYVGNVDYSTGPNDLKEFFDEKGTVNRITILYHKYTGRPKGYAYVEFEKAETVPEAIKLSGTEFKGRPLAITVKRTNYPGLNKNKYDSSRGGSRGGRGGRGTFRGGYGGRGGRGGRGGYSDNRRYSNSDKPNDGDKLTDQSVDGPVAESTTTEP